MFWTKAKCFASVTFGLAFLLAVGSFCVAAEGEKVRKPVEFSGLRGISVTLHKHVAAADLDKLAGWGVNLVRLVVHADPEFSGYDGFFLADGKTFNEAAFKELDLFLDMAAKRNINVIIATITSPGVISGKIWEDFQYWDQLESLWKNIARHYRDSTTVIGYEPMNEPTAALKALSRIERGRMRSGAWTFPEEWKNTPRDYFGLIERVGQAINKIDPNKVVIIASVGEFGHPVNFRWMRPVRVENAVYTFHMYVPHEFTDAGKNGRPPVSYGSTRDREEVLAAMGPVRDFARKYSARIFVGELGLTYYNEGMGASQWLRDVLDDIEENGWSWAYWTYTIDLRNPEISRGRDGSLQVREDTERLTTLKKFWARNKR